MEDKSNVNIDLVVRIFFGITILYPVVGVVLSVTNVIPPVGLLEADDSQRGLFSILFVLIGLFMGVASFVIPRIVARIAASQSEGTNQAQPRIIGIGLAEGAGMMGIVLLVMLGDLMLPFVLWAVALVASVPHLRDESEVR